METNYHGNGNMLRESMPNLRLERNLISSSSYVPLFAESSPHAHVHAYGGLASPSTPPHRRHPESVTRPQTAPSGKRRIRLVQSKSPALASAFFASDSPNESPSGRNSLAQNHQRPSRLREYGRMSLYDRDIDGVAHSYQGAKVLRDLKKSLVGFPLRSTDDFLRKGDGASLQARVQLRELLQTFPVNREPPFSRRGTGGVLFTPRSPANSIFKYLYDNGTMDFCSLRWEGSRNTVVWGNQVRPGLMSWGKDPTDVDCSKWLPIFMEGIREYEEPYRFLSIMGSFDLIEEAGDRLHLIAADLIPPLKKALDTREPSCVAISVELMRITLATDPLVGAVWIKYLHMLSQPLNLYLSQSFSVNMGYSSRQVLQIKNLIHECLTLLQEHGGEDSLPILRKYMRWDPVPLTKVAKGPHIPLKPYTLI